MEYPAEMQRAAGDTREERRRKTRARVAWLNGRQPAYPVREKIVYVDREGPERIVERLVEAKAKIDQREPVVASQKLHPDLLDEKQQAETDEEANARFYTELQTLYGANAWAASGGPEFTDQQKARRDFLQVRVWKAGD